MIIGEAELLFLRLLERSKKLSRTDLPNNIFKIQSNTQLLTTLLSQMQDDKSSHSTDVLLKYAREVNQLSMLIETEQKKTAEEKLSHIQRIPRLFPDFDTDSPKDQETASTVRAISESAAGVRARNRAVYHADLRNQLLGEDNRRKHEAADQDLAFQEKVQEELADNLLTLTRSLKENMKAAGSIINDDNKRLTSMSSQVDLNKDKLTIEGERLAKHAYKCGFDCLLVFIALFIFWSFICMVIIMKLFPKRLSV